MNRYALYCTPEQTRKAFTLGAPLRTFTINDTMTDPHWVTFNCAEVYTPTTEEMIGWLEEQGIYAWVRPEFWKYGSEHNVGFVHIISKLGTPIIDTGETNEDVYHYSRTEAILAAIDMALEYLCNK